MQSTINLITPSTIMDGVLMSILVKVSEYQKD